MARLILDTGVVIAAARGRIDLSAVASADDLALPAVVVAEFLAGSLLDTDAERATAQRTFLDEVLQVVPVHAYDASVAEHHAILLAHVRRTGERRGVHDLVIAATARAVNRTILTTDPRARFEELPDVTSRVVAS